ncbi:hypothetical protein R4P47_13385 [Rhodococcus sp. IEGM 1370]|uniref:hypothetical protein n=1 Tax=Rhodococcus sp. IEGM 1370 TaxID=3082222 RepID=UPI002955AE23|nr:hypothetical protein [Rhodococcus sp. IEGM 1370]MDV8077555.1 hypothetical protein [Rhodococcus sp. IEGM 1370]
MLHAQPSQTNDPLITAGKLQALAVGFLASIYISFGGRFSLTELISVISFPLLILAVPNGPRFFRLFASAFTVAIALFYSGWRFNKPEALIAPAVANVLFTISLAVLIAALLKKYGLARLSELSIGLALGVIAGVFTSPTLSQNQDSWKFGFGVSLALFSVIIVDRLLRRKKLFWALLAGLAVSVVNIYMGSRSLAVFGAISIIFAVVTFSYQQEGIADRIKQSMHRIKLGRIALAAALAGLAVFTLVKLLAGGAFGEIAQRKLTNQSGDLGPLIGARKEIVPLLFSIKESPLAGWGPAPSPPPSVRNQAALWFVEHRYELQPFEIESLFKVPTLSLHSVVLGLFATAGIFAIPLVLCFASGLYRSLVEALRLQSSVAFYLSLTGIWAFFFSPLGDTTRIQLAIPLALGLVVTSVPKRRRTVDPRRQFSNPQYTLASERA